MKVGDGGRKPPSFKASGADLYGTKTNFKKTTHVKKHFIPPFTQLHIIFKHGAKYLFQNIWGSEK
jgi:hypothetical protein